MTVSIALAEQGDVVAGNSVIARTFLQRVRGLLGRPPLKKGEALILPRARQVHTIGMQYPIQVVFCDGDWTVVKVIERMTPMRVSGWVQRARWVIELPQEAPKLRVGDRLTVTGLREP